MSIHSTLAFTLVLYFQLIQTGSVLLVLRLSSVLGFPLYKDTANGRDATHQLYSFAIEFGLAPACLYTRLESSLVPAGSLTAQVLQKKKHNL